MRGDGHLTKPDLNKALPLSPQVADSALEAAEAGAAAVHIHVGGRRTGVPSMELAHYHGSVAKRPL